MESSIEMTHTASNEINDSLTAQAEAEARQVEAEKRAVSEILTNFLSDTTVSTSETATRFVERTHRLMCEISSSMPKTSSLDTSSTPSNNDSEVPSTVDIYFKHVGHIGTPLAILWCSIIDTAIASSASHDRLISLILCIRSQSAPLSPARAAFEKYWAQRFWLDLPTFGMHLRETDHGRAPLHESHWIDPQHGGKARFCLDEPFEAWEWTNLQAFQAHCTISGVRQLGYVATSLAKYLLEEERTAWDFEKSLGAVVAWFQIASPLIRCRVEEMKRADGGPNWLREKDAFGGDRWAFWKAQLRRLGNRRELDEELKHSVKEALSKMELPATAGTEDLGANWYRDGVKLIS